MNEEEKTAHEVTDENVSPIVYSVEYRCKGILSRTKVLHAIEDGILPPNICNEPFRYFILTTGERVEIPMKDTIFKFGPERKKLKKVN